MSVQSAQSNAHASPRETSMRTVPSEALAQISGNPALCAAIVGMVTADGECGVDGWELWRLSASTVCVQRVLRRKTDNVITVKVGVR